MSNRFFVTKLLQLIAAACLVLATTLATTTQAFASVQLLDKVAAVVNDDIVLDSQVRDRMHQVLVNIHKAGQSAPPMKVLRKQVLDQLILESIQLQMARRAGVRISDTQLNDAMTRIAKQNGYDLPHFKTALEADGLSYAGTREQVRREMLISRVQQGSVSREVHISDQEINNFLQSEEGKEVTAPEYHMLHTLIPIPSDASPGVIAKARAYAEQLYKRIQNGESYKAVVGSSHRYKLITTDLQWRKAEDLPSLLTGLTKTLKEGQTAPPIQSPSGFHLVKMEGTRGISEIVQQTHARHILLKPSAIRDDAATLQQITKLRQRILNGADFGELARQYSEDIGSALEGGDLGWTSPGQLVGAFQKAMDNTPVNAISPPFKTSFGWHIVQVLGRRQQDVTQAVRKRVARNFLYKRKFNDELQAWLQKIRDEAYVDYK